MSKDANWFKHDYHSRNDDKVRCLIMQYGIIGFGVFWLIIESLHENNESKIDKKEIKIIAMANNISTQDLQKIISTMIEIELIQEDENSYYSLNVIERKSKFLEKSKKLSDSGKAGAEKRWGNNSTPKEPYSHPIAKDSHPIGSDSREDKRRLDKKRLEENKEEEKKEIDKSISKEKSEFDFFRKEYRDVLGGTVGGLESEFENFKKHKDYKQVLSDLLFAIDREKKFKDRQKAENKGWSAPPKNLKTWINQRCWEQEFPEVTYEKFELIDVKEFTKQMVAELGE